MVDIGDIVGGVVGGALVLGVRYFVDLWLHAKKSVRDDKGSAYRALQEAVEEAHYWVRGAVGQVGRLDVESPDYQRRWADADSGTAKSLTNLREVKRRYSVNLSEGVERDVGDMVDGVADIVAITGFL